MTVRGLAGALRWSATGSAYFIERMEALSAEAWHRPTRLAGWSRAHVVAHVAANAEALGNLVRWAATGVETPMYASPGQRAADIEAGALRPPADLAEWCRTSAAVLATAMGALGAEEWAAEVRTAQGRSVPAAEVPWLRAREVWVHAVDLAPSASFDDLPTDFLVALCEDVVGKRQGSGSVPVTLLAQGHEWSLPGAGTPIATEGRLAETAAYLTGRPSALLTREGDAPPPLGPWL